MKCQGLITGGDGMPKRCSVPATYTVQMLDVLPAESVCEHLCVAHARKVAKTMERTLYKVTRDRDGLAL